MSNVTRRSTRQTTWTTTATNTAKYEQKPNAWIPNPPPLSWWRMGGVLSALAVISYVYVIDKEKSLNLWLCLIISLNPLVRYFFPSQYVPARHSVDTWISHPCLSRFLATIGEPIFLWAEAMCIGVPFWRGPMGYLTIAGESISWVHLMFQSEAIGILEDSTWVVVQIVAFSTGSGVFPKIVSLPFIAYNILIHLPRQGKRIFGAKFCAGWSGSEHEPVDDDSFFWIMPSLIAQQILFTVFLMHMNKNELEFVW